MLMIIFGAGASYDSCSRVPLDPRQNPRSPARNRPPLADGLFTEGTWGDEIKRHQDCVLLFSRLRAASSVEEELERIHGEAEQAKHLERALFALRYYLRDVVNTSSSGWFNSTSGVTNYVTLLGEVEKWRRDNNETVCLITFNWDTLLDDACRCLGWTFADMTSYLNGPSYRLFKLHGSVNWLRPFQKLPGSLKPLGPVEPTDDYQIVVPLAPTYPGSVPAIAIPTISKGGFECPPWHLEALKSAIPEVTRLLIIGWRGMEEHFLRLWAEAGVTAIQRIRIVSGSSEEAFTVWDQLYRSGVVPKESNHKSNLLAGFSTFLGNGELTKFLAD